MNNLPKTVSTTLYISLCNVTDCVLVFSSDMSEYGYTVLGTKKITLDVPQDVDINGAKIDNLKQQKKKLLAETEVKVNAIEDDIQKLLCIESK